MTTEAQHRPRFMFAVEVLDAASQRWKRHRTCKSHGQALDLAREVRLAGLTAKVRVV